jgi:predicted dehydrogenase
MSNQSSRRDFLERTFGVAAATGLLGHLSMEEALADPRSVPRAAAPAAVGQGETLQIGIIGTGGMGTGHVDAFLRLARDQNEAVRIEALADVCQPRLEAASKKVEEAQGAPPATFGRYTDLLARPDLHAVLIASPEHWHAKMAEDAVAAGKDVYVEKPMTLHLKDALRLLDVQHTNPSTIINVGTQFVTISSYREAQRLIAEGAIGKPVWSQTSYCRNSKDGEWLYYGIDPAWEPGVNLDWEAWCGPSGKAKWNPEVYARWRRYKRYSTGIIGDLLVHRITPLVMALDAGWPIRVIASGGHYVDKAMENHDQVNLTIEFEGEHTMIVAGSTANELGLETVIRGHKGNLYVGGRNAVLRPERLYTDELDERTFVGEDHGDDQDELRRQWLRAIRTRTPTASTVELGTKVMVIVDLAARSMWEGGAFGYDPTTRKVKRL